MLENVVKGCKFVIKGVIFLLTSVFEESIARDYSLLKYGLIA